MISRSRRRSAARAAGASAALGFLLTALSANASPKAPPPPASRPPGVPPIGAPFVESPRAVEDPEEPESPKPPPPPSPSFKRSNQRLGLAGGLMFGSSYLISLVAASFSMRSPSSQLPELYAPVVGPWIAIPNIIAIDKRPKKNDPEEGSYDLLKPIGLGLLGVAQGVGALCVVGYLIDRPSPPKLASSSVRVAPYVGLTGAGLVGSF